MAVAINDPPQAGVRWHSCDGEVALAMAGANARRDDALGLDRDDARQTRQLVSRVGRSWFDEVDRHVLPLCDPELHHDQPLDRVGEHESDHEDRHREGDAEHGCGDPKRMPRDVPEHHPAGRAEMARDEWRFEDGPPVSGRRLGTHGLPAAHAPRDGRPRSARTGGAEGEDGRSQHHIEWNAEEQLGKTEELVVEVADGASGARLPPRRR